MMKRDPKIDQQWYEALTQTETSRHKMFHLLGLLPSNPRCKLCNSPFRGIGAMIMKVVAKKSQSRKNPQFCDRCMSSVVPGGAEIELTMLFADVRGSTTLAENMSASDFTGLMNRFYHVATDVLVRSDSLIDKLVGDEIIGLYVPGYAGPDHANKAVRAAQELLRATGHHNAKGPWLPVGIGVHKGVAYVGALGGKDGLVADITALGDNVNITARLASKAGAGEILVSDAACSAAGIEDDTLERRQLELKGKKDLVGVKVMKTANI
ncbi:MAG: adenylate/guanylate cyclase domain-containing protein [Ignavibacteriales bacterium]|nr:adenylate/guanylate cyclase domain-containing protein [Ignavibacteriales bacterium]